MKANEVFDDTAWYWWLSRRGAIGSHVRRTAPGVRATTPGEGLRRVGESEVWQKKKSGSSVATKRAYAASLAATADGHENLGVCVATLSHVRGDADGTGSTQEAVCQRSAR